LISLSSLSCLNGFFDSPLSLPYSHFSTFLFTGPTAVDLNAYSPLFESSLLPLQCPQQYYLHVHFRACSLESSRPLKTGFGRDPSGSCLLSSGKTPARLAELCIGGAPPPLLPLFFSKSIHAMPDLRDFQINIGATR